LNPPRWQIIDHKDNDKLNACRNNLRPASASLNSHNKPQKQGSSSQFRGVVKDCNHANRWLAKFGRVHLGTFKSEAAAAWAYDEHVRSVYGTDARPNGTAKPVNYDELVSRQGKKDSALPKYVSKVPGGMSWRVSCDYPANGIRFNKNFASLEVAIATAKAHEIAVQKVQADIRHQQAQAHAALPITRNKDGCAILLTAKNEEILVDDDRWHELAKETWHINEYGYVLNTHNQVIQRVLLKLTDRETLGDHINNVRADNRMVNLRVATPLLNGHNKKKRAGTSSQYRGVTLQPSKAITRVPKTQRWAARFTYNGKETSHGTYDTEQLAALAWNNKAREIFGSDASRNPVDDVPGWTWNGHRMTQTIAPSPSASSSLPLDPFVDAMLPIVIAPVVVPKRRRRHKSPPEISTSNESVLTKSAEEDVLEPQEMFADLPPPGSMSLTNSPSTSNACFPDARKRRRVNLHFLVKKSN